MTDPGFGLYIHWPFCPSKCPYCDFNSHVRQQVPERAWLDALLKDLAHMAALTPGRTVTSIFFGGGTPSLMAPETVAAVLKGVMALWTLDQKAEVTLEANPGTVDICRFRGYRGAGVNRLSLGVQSLDDASLQFLGRIHDAAAARRALGVAADIFDRYSFDLIYGLPEQSLDDWRKALLEAIDLAGGHLSLYQLTIEAGTAFHTAVRLGEFAMPAENLVADMYELTQELTAEAGLPAYEISNHAAPGQESRHNLVYWRYGDYVGVGPGAHGRLSFGGRRFATYQARLPESWLDAVGASGHGMADKVEVSADEQAEEALMMGLRLREGIPLGRLEKLTGRRFDQLADPVRLAALIDGGFLTLDGKRLIATAAGRQRLDAVLAELLA